MLILKNGCGGQGWSQVRTVWQINHLIKQDSLVAWIQNCELTRAFRRSILSWFVHSVWLWDREIKLHRAAVRIRIIHVDSNSVWYLIHQRSEMVNLPYVIYIQHLGTSYIKHILMIWKYFIISKLIWSKKQNAWLSSTYFLFHFWGL